MKCQKHRRYKAKREPRADCKPCWQMWRAAEKLREKENPTFERTEAERRKLEKRRTYVITSAQNNTPVLRDFWEALKLYCDIHAAELLVVPIRYKNPTSRKDPQEDDDLLKARGYRWDSVFRGHLIDSDIDLHPDLRLMASWKLSATSPAPLGAGMDSVSKHRSAIFGHGQLAMKSVATAQGRLPKLLYTTGSATRMNYSTTGLGKKALFHHTVGAIIVEQRGDNFYMREVVWDGERFYDLNWCYTAVDATPAPRVPVLVMGDAHVWFRAKNVERATFGPGGIVEVLNPEALVWHDPLDFYSGTKHHRGRNITEAVKAMYGWDNVELEVMDTLEYMDKKSRDRIAKVVASNHTDHFTQWLNFGEKGVGPANRKFYHRVMYELLEEARMTERGVVHPDPLELCSRGIVGKNVEFLSADDTFEVGNIEMAMHGHLGPNGCYGSAANLSKIGIRSIIGHSHSPNIHQGVYQVGTSSVLRMEYNHGPSSWMNTHAVVHPNGRRQMIHIMGDGSWRG